MKATAMIVDDEGSNIDGLKQKLEQLFPEIEVVHCFQKPEDAISQLNEEQPDILFLDIQMPRINGFELLSQIRQVNFQVVFVTAYSEFALEAFKQNAVDYVLKPIDNDDLKTAVDKALDIINTNQDVEINERLINLLKDSSATTNKICIPTRKGVSFIPKSEVLHLEGYEGYTKIHLIHKVTITSSYNLGKFEKVLDNSFFKCHKSHIVCLERIRHYENEGYLVLEDDSRIPISRANRKHFLDLFSKL